jgi:hypothetical protein
MNSIATNAISGLIAGACSVYGNTPIDVVKTRMQGLYVSIIIIINKYIKNYENIIKIIMIINVYKNA